MKLRPTDSAEPSPFAPLTPTLPLQVAQRIGGLIVGERIEPGARLKEVELAANFGVSRATIREALRLLEMRGLVRISPQRGAQVTRLSPKELDDLFEVRATILALGSGRAAARCSDADRLELRRLLRTLLAAQRELEDYVAASTALVSTLMRLSDNAAVEAYIAEFALRIGRYVRLGLTEPRDRKESSAIWRALIDAVCDGDVARAEELHRRLALRNRDAALQELARRAAAGLIHPDEHEGARRVTRTGTAQR